MIQNALLLACENQACILPQKSKALIWRNKMKKLALLMIAAFAFGALALSQDVSKTDVSKAVFGTVTLFIDSHSMADRSITTISLSPGHMGEVKLLKICDRGAKDSDAGELALDSALMTAEKLHTGIKLKIAVNDGSCVIPALGELELSFENLP
jgi:hypothetical protein